MTQERGVGDTEVHDMDNHQRIKFNAPEEIYDMLVFMGSPGRNAVKAVYSRKASEIGAASSTDKLAVIAGGCAGKDDATCIVRSQGDFPAAGEVVEPAGSFNMPLYKMFADPPNTARLVITELLHGGVRVRGAIVATSDMDKKCSLRLLHLR